MPIKKAIQPYLPKGLLARALTILFVPLFLVQVVMGYIFFDRHTETILRVLSNTIAGDIALVHEWVEKGYEFKRIQDLAKRHMHLDLQWQAHKKLSQKGPLKHTWLYEFMDDALEGNLTSPYFVRMSQDKIHIMVECRQGLLAVDTDRKRLFSRTTPLVLIWTISTSLILFIVAALFMRNQVRPISRLARAAEAFGQGQEIFFKPEGAREVRQAGASFLHMRQSLQFQLSERMNMLAGVSHDLRTVLTRMKLQIALTHGDNKDLQQDVETMQAMMEEFLYYTRNLHHEEAVATDIGAMCVQLQKEMGEFPTSYAGPSSLWESVRPLLVYRSLMNILLNCRRHATRAHISLEALNGEWQVCIDDDGPGIAPHERDDACMAFHRLDASRNLDQGGVGLGLTIARDGIHAHGGHLYLEESPHGGLRVRMVLPHLHIEETPP